MKQIALLALIVLFVNLQSRSQTNANWKSLSDDSYSIQYPDDWEVNKSGQSGTSFVLLSKQASPQDQFRENVNLLIQNLKGYNIDLNKYVEVSEGQIKTMITNGNLIESKRLNVGGAEFQRVVYTGDQGIYKLKFEQYYWIKNEKAYVLTLTCEINQFDAYKDVGERILNSFQLK